MPAPSLTVVAAEATEALHRLVGRDDADFRDGQLEAVEALVADARAGARRAAHRLGQVGGLLRRHRPAPGRRAPGPTVIVIAAARPDARPDRGRRAGRHPGRDDELGQRRGLGRRARGAGRRRGRRAARQPRAAQQPAVPRRAAARPGRGDAGCSSSTRRTASATGATTSGPTTGGSATCSPACRPTLRCSPRPRPPTRGWSPTSPSSSGRAAATVLTVRGGLARDSLRLGVLPLDAARAAAGLAGRAPRRAARQRHRLHAHRRRPPRTSPRRCAMPGTTVAPTPGAPTPPTASGSRARCGDNEVKALVATSALGHGFRQARPRLRRAPRRAVVAGRLLPAGRPRRPRHRARRRAAAARARGPRHLALLRLGVDAPPGAGRRRARARSPSRREPLSTRRARDRRRRPPHPARAAAQGARRRRRGRSGSPGGWVVHRGAVDLRRRALRAGRRGPPGRAAADARLRAHRRRAGWSSCSECLDDDTAAAVRSLRRCAGPWYPTDGARPARSAPPASGWRRVGCRARAAGAVAHRHGPARRPGPGQDRAPTRRCSPGGRWPGSPTSAGGSGCATCCAADAPAHRATCCGPACRVLADWGWAAAAGRRRGDAVARAARAGRLGGRRARRDRAAAVPRRRSTSRTAGPTGEPGGNSAFRLAGVWDRFAVGPALAAALRDADGPVLLVDDLVDSRWTLTVAARALRQAGADAVLPFALATQS